MRKAALYISLLIVALGCKKEKLPATEPSDPVFSFEGNFGETFVGRQAGNDGYYMYSSHSQQANGLYVYEGEIKNQCSGNCNYGLTVRINDAVISMLDAPMNPDQALYKGAYLLYDVTKEPSVQKVELKPLREYASQESYSWHFQSSTDSIMPSVDYSLTPVMKLGSTYTIALGFDDNVGGCQTTHTTVFTAGSSFVAQVKVAPGSSALSYIFTPEVTGTGPYQYNWEFGDGTSTTVKDPVHVFSSYNSFRVKLTVTKGQESVITYYQVNTLGNGTCNANLSINPLPLDYKTVFKNISFELKDPTGKVYKSSDVVQPLTSFAEVTEVTDYETNSNGHPTKKISLNFRCLMKGPDGTVEFNNGKAVVAVSYKK